MRSLHRMLLRTICRNAIRFKLVGIYRNVPEAKEALEKAEVDLIFLDIQLPGMTGYSFYGL